MVDPLQRRFTQSESRQRYQESLGPSSGSGAGGAFDIAWFSRGQPEASDLIVQFVAVRAFTLPLGLSGSEGYVATAPADGSKTFDVQKNGSSVGSMTFAQGSNTASFSMASDTSFAAGDRLEVVAPGTQDSALADVSATFKGTKP
jgi:hypothetical protein